MSYWLLWNETRNKFIYSIQLFNNVYPAMKLELCADAAIALKFKDEDRALAARFLLLVYDSKEEVSIFRIHESYESTTDEASNQ